MKRLFFLLIPLLLIGAGCGGNAQEQTTNTNADVAQKIVVKKPAGAGTIDYAITACESRGYAAVLKYNKETKETDIFCQFGDGYACDALNYLMGACTTTSTNRIYIAATDGVPDNLRTCTDDEEPVCGKDSVTYVNSCIAALQNAVITHKGVCTEEEIKLAVESTPSTNDPSDSPSNTGSSGSTDSAVASPPTGTPIWTTHLLSIAGSHINGPGAPVTKECTYGSTRVFYLVENCPECFSTLYSNDGKVICHPHNDIKNECPSYFDKNNNGTNCKKV
jgi:putative hemolysin